MSSVLVWDCSSCGAKSIEDVSELFKGKNGRFNKIILFAEEISQIPKGAEALSSIFNATIRLGNASIYDSIVDFMIFVNETNKIGKVSIISDSPEVWIGLINDIIPKEIAIISNIDQKEVIEQQFLPKSISVHYMKWNKGKGVSQIEFNEEEMHSDIIEDEFEENESEKEVLDIKEEKEEEIENQDNKSESNHEEEDLSEQYSKLIDLYAETQSSNYDENSENSAPIYPGKESFLNQDDDEEEEELYMSANEDLYVGKTPNRIKPLTNSETRNVIDLKSPATAAREAKAAEPVSVSKDVDDCYSIPRKYQPLIEAMRTIGKSMIPLNTLVEEIDVVCKQLGVPSNNTMSIIEKANTEGYIILDRTINYIRFRNRDLATKDIEYV